MELLDSFIVDTTHWEGAEVYGFLIGSLLTDLVTAGAERIGVFPNVLFEKDLIPRKFL